LEEHIQHLAFDINERLANEALLALLILLVPDQKPAVAAALTAVRQGRAKSARAMRA